MSPQRLASPTTVVPTHPNIGERQASNAWIPQQVSRASRKQTMSPHVIMKTKTQEKKVLTNAPMERPRTGSSNVGGGAGAGGGTAM